MNSSEEEEIIKHLEEVKLLDKDLYEEDFDRDEIDNEVLIPTNQPRQKRNKIRKAVIALISLLLILTTIGPLAETFNIASIKFLKKSYELSQRTDIKDYKKAVVTVKAENRKGTGFNISSNGVIVTNNHIIEKENEAIVHFPNGPTEKAKVVKKFPDIDIAILTLDNQSDLPYLNIDYSNKWQENDHIYFIGNPLMFNLIANEGEIIGTTASSGLSTSVILIDAPVYKGNSGSPVINQEGQVIGVIYAKGSIKQDGKRKKVGFAVPIDVIPDELLE
jgi:serine protease Do